MNKLQFTALVRAHLTEYRDIGTTYRPNLLWVCERAYIDLMERGSWDGSVDLAWLLWRRETWTPSEDPFDLAVRRVLDVAITKALAKWCRDYQDLEIPRADDHDPSA